MKTKNLNMRSSRMRELVQGTYGTNSTNIDSIYDSYCYSIANVSRNPMNTIPWSNVTYTRSSSNQYKLFYTNNNSNYLYRSVTPPINVAADFRFDFSVKSEEEFKNGEYLVNCRYYINNQPVILGGTIDSGSGTGVIDSSILDASYIRVIILVGQKYDYSPVGYSPVGFFYVDVDSNGNVSLKT
jgi:hypothetical protein